MKHEWEFVKIAKIAFASTVLVREDTTNFAILLLKEQAKIEIGRRTPEEFNLQLATECKVSSLTLTSEGNFLFNVTAMIVKFISYTLIMIYSQISENPGILSNAVPRSITTPSFITEFSPS